MTREEAINTVRNIYQTDKEKEALKILIPELAESEDERIRKDLINLIVWLKANPELCSQYYNDRYDEMLAYIEKHKEHPTNEEMLRTLRAEYEKGVANTIAKYEREERKPNIELIQRSWYMEGYHDGKFEMEPMWILETDEGGPRYKKNERYEQSLEKEQNPIEWSEEGIRTIFDDYVEGRDTYTSCINRLKSLHPQPKQEWSEEDSRILYNVIAYVGYAAGQRGVRNDEFKEANSWLKSLPNGFIVNPSYNEDMVNLLVAEVQQIAECNGVPKQYDAEITWLKSLRPQPHWKPSEEQMDALRESVSFWRGATDKSPRVNILESLYTDLKKL